MKKTFLLTDKMICHSSDSNNKFNVPDRYTAGCQFIVSQNIQPSYITEERNLEVKDKTHHSTRVGYTTDSFVLSLHR
jgi:hypothetical protein